MILVQWVSKHELRKSRCMKDTFEQRETLKLTSAVCAWPDMVIEREEPVECIVLIAEPSGFARPPQVRDDRQ
jgi:hypothetical protein